MDRKECLELLRHEGYTTRYEWEDAPGYEYGLHSHPHETKIIVVSGSMCVTLAGEHRTVGVGDSVLIPAGATHSAKVSSEGCIYMVGERNS